MKLRIVPFDLRPDRIGREDLVVVRERRSQRLCLYRRRLIADVALRANETLPLEARVAA